MPASPMEKLVLGRNRYGWGSEDPLSELGGYSLNTLGGRNAYGQWRKRSGLCWCSEFLEEGLKPGRADKSEKLRL